MSMIFDQIVKVYKVYALSLVPHSLLIILLEWMLYQMLTPKKNQFMTELCGWLPYLSQTYPPLLGLEMIGHLSKLQSYIAPLY